MVNMARAKDGRPMYTIPIAERPAHGPWFSAILFPILFTAAQIGINSAQFLALPLLLLPFVGKKLFRSAIDWTKDGYGRCLIMITVLFGPTSLVLTTDSPPELSTLVERDAKSNMVKLNLPDRLVIMANHQAYTDWMYMWILACYSGHASGLTILLKASLRNIPVVGWGMRFFRFIFMDRSWASDRGKLTKALTALGRDAHSTAEESAGRPLKAAEESQYGSGTRTDADETSGLLDRAKAKTKQGSGRSPVWLLIFPEGTIISDDERPKSKRYADREGVPDFVTVLHPRSTGLLFCLRTLLPQIPDLQLLDVTIGYPGVPHKRYPQEWYGLGSIFFKSVPPPTVHIDLHLYSNLASPDGPVPSLITRPLESTNRDDQPNPQAVPSDTGVASPEETKAFELWLRGVWQRKEERLEKFFKAPLGEQRFDDGTGPGASQVVPVRQQKWTDWIAAFGGGGVGTVAVAGLTLWGIIVGASR